jgi:polyisoprenoid-binding protein YceI
MRNARPGFAALWSLAVVTYCATMPCAAKDTGLSAWSVDRDNSVFAVVIHKAGIGSALAHNHLVAAQDYDLVLEGDPGDSESIRATFTVSAEDLVFDDTDLQSKWFPAIKEAGVLDEPLSEKSDKNRQKIRDSALGKDQLNAEAHPEITASAGSFRPAEDGNGYTATLQITVHGETVERSVPVDITWDEDRLAASVSQSFRFTEFGIEPYSALFGAVKNKDVFNLFVRVEAARPSNS